MMMGGRIHGKQAPIIIIIIIIIVTKVVVKFVIIINFAFFLMTLLSWIKKVIELFS